MINQLRQSFGGGSYLITGAPQCPLSDAFFQMKDMIVGAQFDILWIQFYNNAGCDAVNGNFNFDDWVTFLSGTKSAHATLFIGLPGAPAAAGSGYVSPAALDTLLSKYASRPSFGGVMLWDASFADGNVDGGSGKNYVEVVRGILATVSTYTPTSTSTYPASTTTACANPYTVQSDDYCYSIAARYGTTVQQILANNPSLNSYCDIQSGQVICLPPGATTSTSTSTTASPTSTATCTKTYTVVPGDYCNLIAGNFGLTLDQLRALNPALDAACDLFVGDVLCVSDTPSTTTSSTVPTATPTCVQTYTVVPGDYCYKIATQFGITLDQLRSYNPSLDAACDLFVGDVLCVQQGTTTTTSSSSSSTVVSTTTTTSSVPTTTPTCVQTYTVVPGDYCYKIATQFSITVDQLQSYNPSLDAACDLSVGDVLCVQQGTTTSSTSTSTSTTSTDTTISTTTSSSPTGTPSCSQTYTVVPGDYCYKIATQYGITVAQLMQYNPSVDSNCDIYVGEVLCVEQGSTTSSVSTTATSTTTTDSSTSTSSTYSVSTTSTSTDTMSTATSTSSDSSTSTYSASSTDSSTSTYSASSTSTYQASSTSTYHASPTSTYYASTTSTYSASTKSTYSVRYSNSSSTYSAPYSAKYPTTSSYPYGQHQPSTSGKYPNAYPQGSTTPCTTSTSPTYKASATYARPPNYPGGHQDYQQPGHGYSQGSYNPAAPYPTTTCTEDEQAYATPAGYSQVHYTTSTVRATHAYEIYPGVTTTEVHDLYTTTCTVGESEATPTGSSSYAGSYPGDESAPGSGSQASAGPYGSDSGSSPVGGGSPVSPHSGGSPSPAGSYPANNYHAGGASPAATTLVYSAATAKVTGTGTGTGTGYANANATATSYGTTGLYPTGYTTSSATKAALPISALLGVAITMLLL